MELFTKIPFNEPAHHCIDYNSKVLLLGSCFSENIAKRFNYFKFQNTSNPFGILYHPKAIETLIENAINDKAYNTSDIFFHNERWHSFDAHSDLSSITKEDLLNRLRQAISSTQAYLKDATHIFITLGTAWSYRFLETDRVVANCHKVSQHQFQKELQSVESIIQSLEHIVALIQAYNENAQVIFTVSPVRHIKDGFVENTQSKSHLITAIHQTIESKEKLFYFPSYEIMMDELRDYRFYADDLVHPNTAAIQYIWEKFQTVWISEQAYKTMGLVDSVQKGLNHKPFHPDSAQHQKFLLKLEAQKAQLKKHFPHIVF